MLHEYFHDFRWGIAAMRAKPRQAKFKLRRSLTAFRTFWAISLQPLDGFLRCFFWVCSPDHCLCFEYFFIILGAEMVEERLILCAVLEKNAHCLLRAWGFCLKIFMHHLNYGRHTREYFHDFTATGCNDIEWRLMRPWLNTAKQWWHRADVRYLCNHWTDFLDVSFAFHCLTMVYTLHILSWF